MERYFFFDIDGTLTTPLTADYPDSAREAVRRLQEKGNFVAIASGRLQADAVDVAEELGIDSVISDGGNGVTCCGKILSFSYILFLINSGNSFPVSPGTLPW